MIAIRKCSSLLVSASVVVLLAACGSDDNDFTQEPPRADVNLDQLAGTWFGTFDDKSTVRTFEFTVDAAGGMTGVKLEGADQGLTGSITKATEVPRAFRFALTSGSTPVATGMMMVDPAGAHMLYLSEHSEFGVLQKGAIELPTYALTDIDGAWSGDTLQTAPDFTTFAHLDSSAQCAPTDPAPPDPTSQCTATIDSVTRAISNVRMDDPAGRGRFISTFTNDPAVPPGDFAVMRAYLSPDKLFAAVWACSDFRPFSMGSPEGCDFSAWTKTQP